MSAITAPPPTRPTQEQADPFFYGFRYVPRTRPDGGADLDMVPLTLEDILHPQEDDKPVISERHDTDRVYLREVFRTRLRGVPGGLVLSDCGLQGDYPGLRHHAPDVAVVFGVRDTDRNWKLFDVAEEGVRPVLVLEIVSESSREADLVRKVEQYHLCRYPLYIIVDRDDDDGTVCLLAYRWTPDRYVKVPLFPDGRLWLDPLGLWLALKDGRVVCYDGETGEELGDYTAVTLALQEQRSRADAEHSRADAEQARADAEKARADAAQARADEEAQARLNAEARLRQLEAHCMAETANPRPPPRVHLEIGPQRRPQ